MKYYSDSYPTPCAGYFLTIKANEKAFTPKPHMPRTFSSKVIRLDMFIYSCIYILLSILIYEQKFDLLQI